MPGISAAMMNATGGMTTLDNEVVDSARASALPVDTEAYGS